eukprot:7013733-Lingulodinium_polyedra.AAC.1
MDPRTLPRSSITLSFQGDSGKLANTWLPRLTAPAVELYSWCAAARCGTTCLWPLWARPASRCVRPNGRRRLTGTR